MENKFKIDNSHKFARAEVFIGVCIIKTRKFDVYFKDNCQLSK